MENTLDAVTPQRYSSQSLMYNKLFTKILDSSIWLEPTATRIVWVTFLAVMDEHGFAQFASVANVAHRARVSADEAREAVATLEGTDDDSSDPDNGGRRLERVPGGWVVLNAEKHRRLVTRAIVQEQTRARVQKHRDRKRNSNAQVTPSEAEAVSEARSGSDPDLVLTAPTEKTKRPSAPPKELADPATREFIEWFAEQYSTYSLGAEYTIVWPRDMSTVKRLLRTLTVGELHDCALILLDPRTDDKFIQESDRGIGMLSTKINWLNQRRAAFLAKQMRQR